MKSKVIGILLITVLILEFAIQEGKAALNVNVNVGLPGLFFPGPPALVVIPGSYVYYPPDAGVEIFFYHGSWYRPYRGGWYIGEGCNGPWRTVEARRVPGPLMNVPSAYRRISSGHQRVPYGQVRKNWRAWENQRHWDSQGHPAQKRRERASSPGERVHGRGHGRGRG